MRKLFPVVVLVIALLVALGVVFVSRGSAPDPLAPLPAAPTEQPVEVLTPLSVPANTQGQPAPGDQRVAAGTTAITTPAVEARLERHLRVRVVVEVAPDEVTPARALPRELEVQACNEIGAVFDPYRDGDAEFLFRSLRAGSYVVVARCEGFVTAWQRVDVRSDLLETTAELVLKRPRILRVRWAGNDGRPVHESLKVPEVTSSSASAPEDPARVQEQGGLRFEANPDGSVRVGPSSRPGPLAQPDSIRVQLSAVVSRVAPPVHGPLHASLVAHRWTRFLRVERDESGATHVGPASWIAPQAQPKDPTPNPPSDTFALLTIDDPGRVYVSVWRDDSRMDGAWIEPDQTEVVFVTPVEALNVAWCTVRARVLDALTSLPVERAAIVLYVGADAITDAEGRGQLDLPPGDHELAVRADGHDELRVRVEARPGLEIDLGDLRLVRTRDSDAGSAQRWYATFRTVDAQGAASPNAAMRLVPIGEYDRLRMPIAEGVVLTRRADMDPARSREARRSPAREPGHVTFETTAPGPFVLLSERPEIDVEPRLVTESDFSRDPDRVVDEIVVRRPSVVCFRFVEPPYRGTKIVVETPTGLPVAVLDTNEFGVVQTWLGARSYRIHLVEDGTATDSLNLTVDADPFVFEIRR